MWSKLDPIIKECRKSVVNGTCVNCKTNEIECLYNLISVAGNTDEDMDAKLWSLLSTLELNEKFKN